MVEEEHLRVFLERLDRASARVGRVEKAHFGHEGRPVDASRGAASRREIDAQVLRSSMRSILVSSSIAQLPVDVRERAEVARRLNEVSAEADFALSSTLAALNSMTEEDFATFDEDLRASDDCIEGIVRGLDQHAREAGVSRARRRHLKAMARNAAWSLRNDGSERAIKRTVRQVTRHLERLEQNPDRMAKVLRADTKSAAYWRAWTLNASYRYAGTAPAAPPTLPEPVEGAAPVESDPASDAVQVPGGASPNTAAPASEVEQSSEATVEHCPCEDLDWRCRQAEQCPPGSRNLGERAPVEKATASDTEPAAGRAPPVAPTYGEAAPLPRRRKGKKTYRPNHSAYSGGVLMVGSGLSLIVLGAAFAPFTLGISAVAVTPGVLLIIFGAIWLGRYKHR